MQRDVHRCRFALGHMIAIAVSALALLCQSVHAQGIRGIIHDPIRTGELLRDIEPLHTSKGQQRAIMQMHDSYLAAYRELLDGPVARFLDDLDENWLMPISTEAVDRYRREIDRVERIYNQREGIEDRLFADIATVLTEQQQERVQRIRMARQRRLIEIGVGRNTGFWTGSSTKSDLSEIVRQLNFTAGVREIIDPIMADYEHRLTRLMRSHKSRRLRDDVQFRRANIEYQLETARVLGMDSAFTDDPQRSAEWFTEMGRLLREQPELRDHIIELSERPRRWYDTVIHERRLEKVALNRATHRVLLDVLPEPERKRWKVAYYGNIYSSIASYVEDFVSPSDLRRLTGLTRAQRDQVETDVLDVMDELADEIIRTGRALDANGFATENYSQQDEARREEQREITQPLRDKFREKLRTSRKVLESLLTDKQRAQLGAARFARTGSRPLHGYSGVDALGETGAVDAHRAISGSRMSWSYPAAIDETQTVIIANLLDLSGEERKALNEAHQDYHKQYEQRIVPLRAKEREVRLEIWDVDEENNIWTHNGVQALRAHAAVGATIYRETVNLDDAFFDVIAETVAHSIDDAWLECAAMYRRRIAHFIHPNKFNRPQGDAVDLVTVLFYNELKDSDRTAVQAILEQYAGAMGVLQERRYAKKLEWVKAYETSRWANNVAADEDPELREQIRSTSRAETTRFERSLTELDAQIARLNAATMKQITAALSEDEARRFKRAYQRIVYPQVYADPYAPWPALDRARRLPSLASSQRDSMLALANDNRYEYEQLSEQMTHMTDEMAQNDPRINPLHDQRVEQRRRERAQRKRKRQFDRLEFDRSEINSRTVWMMELLLNDQQIAACAPPPMFGRR